LKGVKQMNERRGPAMNWQEYQTSLFKHMPVDGSDLNIKSIKNFVEKTIKNAMAMQPNFQSLLNKDLDYRLFETHRFIFVRCRLPDGISLKSMRFYVKKSKLKIEYSGKSEEILLPSNVNENRIVARIQDGILEIRMPKSSGESETFHEIFIRE
jgi:HSP20 family protein